MPLVELVVSDTRLWLPGATMLAYPNSQQHAAGYAPQVGGFIARDMFVNDAQIFNVLVWPGPGAGNRPPITATHREHIVVQHASVAGVFRGYSPRTPLYPGPLLSAFADVPTVQFTEAARWDILIARPTALSTLDLTGGVALILSSGAFANGIVTDTLNSVTLPPGYAVVGDGATGYRFNVRGVLGGPLTTDIPIAWPVPVDEFAKVSFRVSAATATVNQQFRCLINDVQIFTQDLGAVGAPTTDPGFRLMWRKVIQGSNGAFGNLLTTDDLYWWGTREIF